MKQRAVGFGRNPDQLFVIPSVQLMVRSTEGEAKRAEEELLSLISPALAISTLSLQIGFDLSGYPPGDQLPEIPLTNGGQWVQQQIIAMARKEKLSIGELARRVTVSRASFAMAGTPEQIADMCESWFTERGADGLSLAPNYLPGALEDFVDQVVPILQKRGLFRTDYEGATLRENLGLARPPNTFVANPGLGVEPTMWR